MQSCSQHALQGRALQDATLQPGAGKGLEMLITHIEKEISACEREREITSGRVVLVASYAACSILRVLTQWGATLVII